MKTRTYLNLIAKDIYKANIDKGFYNEINELSKIISTQSPHLLKTLDSLITAQRLALITSETSETLESDRKGKVFGLPYDNEAEWKRNLLSSEKSNDSFIIAFDNYIKDTEEDEVADQFIRLLDYVGMKNIDIDFHIEAKLKYNSLRPFKHGKKY